MKKWFRRIHLVLALLSGLFLISLSVSGALMLYAKDIQAFIHPQYWLVSEDHVLKNDDFLPLSVLVTKIEQASKEKIHTIERAEHPTQSWQVKLADERYLNVNPYNGKILLIHNYYDTFYGFTMAWHRWLLFRDGENKTPLKVLMSITSLVLILEVLVGCYLWLKPKHRLKRLNVRWRAKGRVWLQQLHGTLGIILCIPLLLIAFSGMTFHWKIPTMRVVEWLTHGDVEQHSYQEKVKPASTSYQLDKAYQQARLALTSGEVYRIYLPKADDQPLALRMKMPIESHGNSWSWANPYTGESLAIFNASKASLTTQVWNFRYKFHIGEFLGWPIKVLWLFISLLPVFFVCSGVYLAIKRRK